MAAIARPTWAEVHTLDDIELTAIGIVRGQMQGDTYIWDHEWVDDEGATHYGMWKSRIDEENEEPEGPTEG